MRPFAPISLILLAGLCPAFGVAGPAKSKAAASPAKAAVNPEAQAVRQAFQKVLDSVDGAWFGKAYQDSRSVDVNGTMELHLSAAAINAKASQLSQGQLKGIAAKGGKASLALKGSYYANGDFRTETSGDFGHIVYTRVGRRGFMYSQEQNAYTTAVDLPPADAPLSFMGWFRQVVLDIKAAYVDAPTFKASYGKDESQGGHAVQTLVFYAPSGAYDPAKREQNLKETFGFWKRGRMEISYDKATHLPYKMSFNNDGQGVHTTMTFQYQGDGHLQTVTIANRSKGMEGPGYLQISYGGDGLMSHISGELTGRSVKWDFSMGLSWPKDRRSLTLTPPPIGANKKGGDEFQTAVLVSLASQVFDLQRNGLNLMAPKIAAGK
nr:hypothetical protein [uncultured Holophaga sp.]